jgi:uncharacterized OB-fold protein
MEIARHWRLNNQRYTLTGAVCACCGKRFVSPRPVCDVCHTSGVSMYQVEQPEALQEVPARVYGIGRG